SLRTVGFRKYNNNGVTISDKMVFDSQLENGEVVAQQIDGLEVDTSGVDVKFDGRDSLEDLAVQLMERAREEGVSLVGPGGLLQGLPKTVLEAALDAELREHLGYGPYDPAGHHSGNSRNGTRTKTVNTDIGSIEIDVPRDR